MQVTRSTSTVAPDVQAKWDEMAKSRMQKPAHLTATDADGTVHLDNVRWGFDEVDRNPAHWNPRWKDAAIHPDQVADVYLGMEPFAPQFIGGHSHLVFEFKQPVTNADGEHDNRLVVSAEAWVPPGQEYTLSNGTKDQFGLIYTVGSFGDRVQRLSRREGRELHLHKLDLNAEQKEQLTRNALAAATQERTGEYYHTFKNSCYSSVLNLLNTVLPEHQQIQRFTPLLHQLRPSKLSPATAGLMLEHHGLSSDKEHTKILPDARMWPTAPQTFITRHAQEPWWGAAGRGTGLAVGAGVGALGGVTGAVVGGVAGFLAGGLVADHLRVFTGGQALQPDSYFPAHVKQQLGIDPPGSATLKEPQTTAA